MPLISTVTGSFTAGRRASAFGSAPAWAPTNLGNDLRMWLNPSDTTTTTFQSGTNSLTSITDASGNSGATININNTPQQSTEDNKEIIVPNGAIYSGTITNFSAKETRRVDMVVGIGYDADLLKAKQVLQEMVEADPRILQEPAPTIAVAELADSSVNFVVRPWVQSADFWGVKFDFTEAVKLRFDKEGISIPFPQMDVHLHKDASE